MNMQSRPVMVMAGGTGGHVYPALAVAQALRGRGVPVVWLGTRRGLEARVVPAAGFAIAWLSIAGLRRKNLLTWLLAPVRVLYACLQAGWIILRLRPRLVLGMGGFASGPGGLMCRILRRPLVIHEQNASPGLTNRLLARVANSVLQAFPGSFKPAVNALHTGNPVRADIAALADPERRLAGRQGRLRVLVVGGSQGATFLNECVPKAIRSMPDAIRPEVHHQAGVSHADSTAARYRELELEAEVVPFLDAIATAYEWADLVIARAGAMTVAELAAAGLASILIPYPHAVDDHQTLNARFLADRGAALLADQRRLSYEQLGDWLGELAVDRGRLLNMARQARAAARPDATDLVVRECMLVAESYWV